MGVLSMMSDSLFLLPLLSVAYYLISEGLAYSIATE
jgi:hypothetical protein